MLLAYLGLLLAALFVLRRASRWPTRHVHAAGAGAALAVVAVITGFSIGPWVAALSAVLVMVAAAAGEPRGGRTA